MKGPRDHSGLLQGLICRKTLKLPDTFLHSLVCYQNETIDKIYRTTNNFEDTATSEKTEIKS